MKEVKNLKITQKCIAALMTVVVGGYAIYYSYHRKKDEENTTSNNQNKTVIQNDNQETINNEKDKEYHGDKFAKIRLLEQYANMSPMELEKFIKKYSGYALLDYDHAIEILNKSVHDIDENYTTFKEGIVCTLFNKALEEEILSINCPTDSTQKRYQEFPEARYDMEELQKKLDQRKKQEKIILDMCDDLDMNKDDKTIFLAIYRIESGSGADPICVYNNNYGCNRIPYSLEYCSFTTPEFGMYYAISHIKYDYLNELKSQGYTDPYTLIDMISKKYSELPIQWSSNITNEYDSVNSEYNFFDNEEKKTLM